MVHSFRQNGVNIALDVESGAVHILTDEAFKILNLIKEPMQKNCPDYIYENSGLSKAETDEVYGELYELYENGELFAQNVSMPIDIKNAPIKSMCLHISHDCNMRCKYCFASGGDFHHGKKLMSAECGKKALDFLFESSKSIKNLEVDFFGGEPLLNFDVVKEIVAYGREREKELGKNIRFTMTTNATLLNDDIIDFLCENMSNIVLSLDGTKETNDNLRTFANGKGTYDVIMKNCKKLVERRGHKDYYIRGTYTRANLDFTKDVLHFVDNGFLSVSVEPVVLPETSEFSIRKCDLPTIFAEYEKLADEMIAREKRGEGFCFFHFMIDLDNGPCVYKRTKGCGTGCEYVAITPDGDIYPCHQFVEYTNYRIGNIFDGTFNKEIKTEFSKNNVVVNETCKNCFAKYFCGGGCMANNFGFNKDITKPYEIACDLEKKRLECALYIKAKLAQED